MQNNGIKKPLRSAKQNGAFLFNSIPRIHGDKLDEL